MAIAAFPFPFPPFLPLCSLAGYPFSYFLAALAGMSACSLFAGMVSDMRRQNVIHNTLIELQALRKAVMEVETG